MIEKDDITLAGHVVNRVLVIHEMIEGNAQTPDHVLGIAGPGILGGDILVVDIRREETLERLPIPGAERSPERLDGLAVGLSGHGGSSEKHSALRKKDRSRQACFAAERWANCSSIVRLP